MQELVKLLNKKNLKYLDAPIKDVIQILLIEHGSVSTLKDLNLRVCCEDANGKLFTAYGNDFTDKEKKYIIEKYDLLNTHFYSIDVWKYHYKINKHFWRDKDVLISYTAYCGFYSLSYGGFADYFTFSIEELEEIIPTLRNIKFGTKLMNRENLLDKNIRKKEQELKNLKQEKEDLNRISKALKNKIGEDEYSKRILLNEIKKF